MLTYHSALAGTPLADPPTTRALLLASGFAEVEVSRSPAAAAVCNSEDKGRGGLAAGPQLLAAGTSHEHDGTHVRCKSSREHLLDRGCPSQCLTSC